MNTEMQFVPYGIAKKLSEKGFNEHCMMFYTGKGNLEFLSNTNNCFNEKLHHPEVSAPTYQKVLGWFREKKIRIVESPKYKDWNVFIQSKFDNSFYELIFEGSINEAIKKALTLIK